jgi:hypothetical protein
LTAAYFEGVAPDTFGTNVFQSAAPDFSVYFSTSATTGFTVPTWKGYPASAFGPDSGVVNWLMTHGLPVESDLASDDNHDGVTLLMACALNLDPAQNLSGSLPQPVLASDLMSLTFYSGTAGVSYTVETCTNFSDWTTEGVTLSEPDENQMRTATVALGDSSQFMRLKVSY